MKWNWQQNDWPRFSWSPDRLASAEEHFLLGGGVIFGTVRHVHEVARDGLTVSALSEEAVTSSEIEGEILDRESVQSSVRRELGLATEARRVSPAEQGIAEAMVKLFRESHRPLDEETLCAWHEMLLRGRRDLRDLGRYRTHSEPMRLLSGRVDRPTVHFEAPPSSRVPDEMATFIDWFNRTAPSASDPLPALTRAGIAHLYFESIHPFEDGNGRIGRIISEKALAQGLGRPTLTALAATILLHRRSYYAMLEKSSRSNQIEEWVVWFAEISLEAQQRTLARIEFLIEKTRLLDRLADELNERQEKVLLRVLEEGPGGFDGGLSAGKYIAIAKTSPATARRDLSDLVEKGAFTRTGQRRHARYHLAITVSPVTRVRIDPAGNVSNSPLE